MASNPKITFEADEGNVPQVSGKIAAQLKEADKQAEKLAQSQARNSAAIDTNVKALQLQAVALGKTEREQKLLELTQRGATAAQHAAANAALKHKEAFSASQQATAKSAGIDKQVQSLRDQAAVLGKTARETKLYELAQAGATKAQLASASAALKQVESFERLQKFALLAVTIPLAIGAALFKVVKDTVGAIDDLDEAAQGLGVTTVAFAEMRMAAKEAGAGPEQLEKALGGLNTKVQQAINGNTEAAALFNALGVSIKDSGGNARPTEKIFADIADRIRQFTNDGAKGALLAELFGQKIGPKLAAYLNQGSEGLRKFSGVTEENVEESRKLQSEIDKLSASYERLKLAAAGTLAGVVNKVLDAGKAQHADKQVEALTKRFAQLKQELNTQKNPEFLQAINEELAEIEIKLKGLQGLSLDRFIAGSNALRRVNQQRSAEEVLADAKAAEEAEKLRKKREQAAETAAASAESFLHQLDKQVEKTNLNEFAALRLEAAHRGVTKAAEPNIAKLEKAKNLQEAITLYVQEQARLEKEKEEAFAFTRGLNERVQGIQLETELIGKNELEQRKLTAAREIDQQVAERGRGLSAEKEHEVFKEGEETKRRVNKELEAQANKATTQSLKDYSRELTFETELIGLSAEEHQRAILIRDLERRGIDATSEAYRVQIGLIDEITKQTKRREDRLQLQADIEAVSRTAADMIGQFAKTGDIKEFFKTLTDQLLNLTTELLIVRPLMESFSKALTGQANSSGAGSFIGLIGSLFGGSGAAGGSAFSSAYYGGSGVAFASGTDYVPKTGMALVHQGERIIPANQNRGGGGGGSTVVNNNFTIVTPDGNISRATQSQIAAKVGGALGTRTRKGFA